VLDARVRDVIMPTIALDEEPKAVRDFVRRLRHDRSETVLTLKGRTVARVIQPPRQMSRLPKKGEWTIKLSRRRVALIHKEIEGKITPAEQIELEDLTARMRRYIKKVAPIPIEGAERLLANLLMDILEKQAAEASGNSDE
jgi:hypothetical protein